MSASALLLPRRQSRPRLALVLLSLLLLGGSLVHLGLGARWIAPQTVLQALFHYDPRNFDHRIIVDLRLVRLAAALLTGAALGVAGLLLQTVIRNPLGEPHILGLNAGGGGDVGARNQPRRRGVSQTAHRRLRRGAAVWRRDAAVVIRARWRDAATHYPLWGSAVGVCLGGHGGDSDPR